MSVPGVEVSGPDAERAMRIVDDAPGLNCVAGLESGRPPDSFIVLAGVDDTADVESQLERLLKGLNVRIG